MSIILNFWTKFVEPTKVPKYTKEQTIQFIFTKYGKTNANNISLLKTYLIMLSKVHRENLANDLRQEYNKYVKDMVGIASEKIGSNKVINLENFISTMGSGQALYETNMDYINYDKLWDLMKYTQKASVHSEIFQYIVEEEQDTYVGNIKYYDTLIETIARSEHFALEIQDEGFILLRDMGIITNMEDVLERLAEMYKNDSYSIESDTWVLEEVGGDKYIYDGVQRFFVESNINIEESTLGSNTKPFWKRFIPKLIVKLRKEPPMEIYSTFWDNIIFFKKNWVLHLATLLFLLPAIMEMYPHYYNYWIQWVGQPYRLFMRYYHGTDYILSNMQQEIDFMLLGCKLTYIILILFLFYIMYGGKIGVREIVKFILRNETYFLLIGLYITFYYSYIEVKRREVRVEGPWRGYLRKIIMNTDVYLPQKQVSENYFMWTYKDTLRISSLLDFTLMCTEIFNGWVYRYKYDMPGSKHLFTLDWLNMEGQRPLSLYRRMKYDYNLAKKKVLKYVRIPLGFEEKEASYNPRDKYKWRLQQRYYYAKLKGLEENRNTQFRERMERQYMYYPDYYYMGEYVGNSIQFLDELENRNKLFSSYFRDAINMFQEHILLYPVKINEFRDWYRAHQISAPYCPWNGNLRRVWQKEIFPQKFDGKRSMKYDYWYSNNIMYPYVEEISDLQKQHMLLTEKKTRFEHWETEMPLNTIQTGSLNVDVSQSYYPPGDKNIEPWIYGIKKLNIFKRYYYTIMDKYFSRVEKTWGKPLDIIPQLWTDTRREANYYRWRNEIEYGPSLYGSNIRKKDQYEFLGIYFKEKLLNEMPFNTVKYKRDFLRERDKLILESNLHAPSNISGEAYMHYAFEELMEDLNNMREMGVINISQYREMKHWLIFDFASGSTAKRNSILLKLKRAQKVMYRIKREVSISVSNLEYLRERKRCFDNYKIDIFSWGQSKVQQMALGKRKRLELRRPLHNRFLMRTLRKNKKVIREPYMEEATQNIFKAEKILPLLSKWKDDDKFFYKMLSSLRVPISLNADARAYIIKSPLRYKRFYPVEKQMVQWMAYEHWWTVRYYIRKYNYWRTRESILLNKLKVIREHQAMEWDNIQNFMKNWVTNYAKEQDHLNNSIMHKIVELSNIFDNKVKIARKKVLIPNEGPAMGYYYKDMHKQNYSEGNIFRKHFEYPTLFPRWGYNLFKKVYYYCYPGNKPVLLSYKQEYNKAIIGGHRAEFYSKKRRIKKVQRMHGGGNDRYIYGNNKLLWFLNENKKVMKPLYTKNHVLLRNKQYAMMSANEYGQLDNFKPGVIDKTIIDKSLEIKEKLAFANRALEEMEVENTQSNVERNFKFPHLNVMRRMTMRNMDSEAIYPWDLSTIMLGSYGFKGGPVEMDTNNWAAKYGGAHILREIHNMGRAKRWMSDDKESFSLGSKVNYIHGEFLKNSANLDARITFLQDIGVDSKNNYEANNADKQSLTMEGYIVEGQMGVLSNYAMKNRSKMGIIQPPGSAEAYRDRSHWIYQRDSGVYKKRNNKKYDYSINNNLIPNEYYTVGREYWMPSKLYVEDIITDADIVNRELALYELHRFLLLRYDWPLEIIIVNALNGFDLAFLNFLIF